MPNVLIASSRSNSFARDRLYDLAAAGDTERYRLVEDPDVADLVIFAENASVDPDFALMRSHPIFRRASDRACCVCESDRVVPRWPGMYTGLLRRHQRSVAARGGVYFSKYQNYAVKSIQIDRNPDLLFSFVGDAQTHPVRRRLFKLQHPEAVIQDTSSFGIRARADRSGSLHRQFEEDYAKVLARSRFVLCPRGLAPSSVRLFETLRAGRIPVIVSDAWVPPEGPDWASACVFVRQSDVDNIPSILTDLDERFETMSRAATRLHREWFSDKALFGRLVEWLLPLRLHAGCPFAVSGTYLVIERLRSAAEPARLRRRLTAAGKGLKDRLMYATQG